MAAETVEASIRYLAIEKIIATLEDAKFPMRLTSLRTLSSRATHANMTFKNQLPVSKEYTQAADFAVDLRDTNVMSEAEELIKRQFDSLKRQLGIISDLKKQNLEQLRKNLEVTRNQHSLLEGLSNKLAEADRERLRALDTLSKSLARAALESALPEIEAEAKQYSVTIRQAAEQHATAELDRINKEAAAHRAKQTAAVSTIASRYLGSKARSRMVQLQAAETARIAKLEAEAEAARRKAAAAEAARIKAAAEAAQKAEEERQRKEAISREIEKKKAEAEAARLAKEAAKAEAARKAKLAAEFAAQEAALELALNQRAKALSDMALEHAVPAVKGDAEAYKKRIITAAQKWVDRILEAEAEEQNRHIFIESRYVLSDLVESVAKRFEDEARELERRSKEAKRQLLIAAIKQIQSYHRAITDRFRLRLARARVCRNSNLEIFCMLV